MLTINTGLMSVSGTKFKGAKFANYKKDGVINNNFQTNQNALSGANKAQPDYFIKSNPAQSLSFKGLFGTKIEQPPIVTIPKDEAYDNELKKHLNDKFERIWAATKHNPQFKTYFEKVEIKKPELVFVDNPDPERSVQGLPVVYNWGSNRIVVNMADVPNIVLVQKGNMAISSTSRADEIVKENALATSPDGKLPYIKPFEDLGTKSLTYALDRTGKYDRSVGYYQKLTPSETAWYMAPQMAGAMDQVVMAHVLYNTDGMNPVPDNSHFELGFERCPLPGSKSIQWVESYPFLYNYYKEPFVPAFDPYEDWTIKTGTDIGDIKVSFSELADGIIESGTSKDNMAFLASAFTALNYLDSRDLIASTKEREWKYTILKDYQLAELQNDIRERLIAVGVLDENGNI